MITLIITIFQIISLYIWSSFLEWIVHKHVMHRNTISRQVFEEHAIAHHKTYFPTCEANPEETPESRINLRFEGRTLLFFILASLPLCIFAAIGFWWHLLIPVIWAISVWYIWGEIHDEMHFPRDRWFSNTKLFKFWHRWHCEHHRRQGKNLGIVCIGADFVLGTASLPPKEDGSINSLKS